MSKLIYIKVSLGFKKVSNNQIIKVLNEIGLSPLAIYRQSTDGSRLIKVLPLIRTDRKVVK